MNSIIEAQQEFTNCFGELTLRHMTSEVLLPNFSREKMQYDEFIDTHSVYTPGAIVIKTAIQRGNYSTRYKYIP